MAVIRGGKGRAIVTIPGKPRRTRTGAAFTFSPGKYKKKKKRTPRPGHTNYYTSYYILFAAAIRFYFAFRLIFAISVTAKFDINVVRVVRTRKRNGQKK